MTVRSKSRPHGVLGRGSHDIGGMNHTAQRRAETSLPSMAHDCSRAAKTPAVCLRPNVFTSRHPRAGARRVLGIGGVIAALTIVVTAMAVSTAESRECRKNYYRCSLNRDGRIDPANPDCCWQPLAGPPARAACAPGFYRCDLNAGGRIDPRHPGCCWAGR